MLVPDAHFPYINTLPECNDKNNNVILATQDAKHFVHRHTGLMSVLCLTLLLCFAETAWAHLQPDATSYSMPDLELTYTDQGCSLTMEQQQGLWTSHAAGQLAPGAVAHLG